MDSGEVAEVEKSNMTDVVAALPDVLPSETFIGIDHRILDNSGFDSPTSVQRRLIPAIMSGRNVVTCAPDETGKTSGYLMPIISRMLEDDDIGHGDLESGIVFPSVLIFTQAVNAVPAVYDLCVKLRANTLISCAYVTEDKKLVTSDIKNTEVVVASIGVLYYLSDPQLKICLDRVKFIILDDVYGMSSFFFRPASYFSKAFPNTDGIQVILAASYLTTNVSKQACSFVGQKFLFCSHCHLKEISGMDLEKYAIFID